MFRVLTHSLHPSTTTRCLGRLTPIANSHLLSSLPSSSPPASITSSLYLLPSRTVKMDQAVKVVGVIRRKRRMMLRRLAGREGVGRQFIDNQKGIKPPVASYENSAMNLNQFITFLHRQYQQAKQRREQKENEPTLLSTKIVRKAAQASWQLTFERLKDLMETPGNHTFRACEEIIGALSDPMTDLGQRGLTEAEWIYTMDYIRKSMDVAFSLVAPHFEAAKGEFLGLDAEDQYLVAGIYSVRYLTAILTNDTKAADSALQAARALRVLAPERTLLHRAMAFDIYPAHDPASLTASEIKTVQLPPTQADRYNEILGLTKDQAKKLLEEGKCLKCQQTGHHFDQCPTITSKPKLTPTPKLAAPKPQITNSTNATTNNP